MAEKKLTPKQRRFILEYLLDGNATQAAVRAGYSARTAHQQGYEQLQRPEVKSAIEAAESRRLAKVEAKGEKVLAELAHAAYSDPINLFRTDYTLKALEEMEPAMRRCIKSIEFEELFDGKGEDKFKAGRVVKITLWDKTKSLELLGRNQKLFTDKVEHSASESLADLLTRARTPEPGK